MKEKKELEYTREGFQQYMDMRGLTNKALANILGVTPQNIRYMLRYKKNEEIPTWSKAMIYEFNFKNTNK